MLQFRHTLLAPFILHHIHNFELCSIPYTLLETHTRHILLETCSVQDAFLWSMSTAILRNYIPLYVCCSYWSVYIICTWHKDFTRTSHRFGRWSTIAGSGVVWNFIWVLHNNCRSNIFTERIWCCDSRHSLCCSKSRNLSNTTLKSSAQECIAVVSLQDSTNSMWSG